MTCGSRAESPDHHIAHPDLISSGLACSGLHFINASRRAASAFAIASRADPRSFCNLSLRACAWECKHPRKHGRCFSDKGDLESLMH